MRDGRRTRAIARASVALVCAAVAAGAFAQGRTTGREPADDATPRRGAERVMGARAGREVSLAAAGDVLAHGTVEATARRYASRGGYLYALGAVRASVESADVGFVNLETPLTTRYREVNTSRWPPTLGSDYGLERAISMTGFDVVSVANNHALDQTESGLAETVERLRAARLGAIGAGPTVDEAYGAWVVQPRGVRVAFVAFTHPMNPVGSVPARRVGTGARMYVARLWDQERVDAAIRRAREQADVVVVSVHWGGNEQAESVSRQQRRRARDMVEAGADVVLGHGPHRIHPVEEMESARGGALVAYSLGNLISNMGYRYRRGMRLTGMTHPSNGHPGNRDVVVLRVTARVSSEGRVEIGDVTADLYWTDNVAAGDIREVRVVPIREMESPLREERETAMRAALGPRVQVTSPGR